jgi:hypothetical protein
MGLLYSGCVRLGQPKLRRSGSNDSRIRRAPRRSFSYEAIDTDEAVN